jgi:hypothetical protein
MMTRGTWWRRLPWALMVASSLVLLVGFGWAFGAHTFGNVAEWAAALGTIAAFGATVALLRQEVEARRRDVAERERRQAALVSCWMKRGAAVSRRDGGMDQLWYLTVRNASEELIHRVRVHVTSPPTGWALVTPGETTETITADLDTPSESAAEITFIDAAGLGWHRRGDGVLVRYPVLDGHGAVEPDSQGC